MKKKCEVCGREGSKLYLPINPIFKKEQIKYGYSNTLPETLNAKEYVCKYCDSPDRERLCASFFQQVLQRNVKLNILEIAPGKAMKSFFSKNFPYCNYYTTDLFMDEVDFKADIQDMSIIGDNSFDIVICFHVLEHVKSDHLALKEIYRILKKDGLALLLVPIDLRQKIIDEEWGLSADENIRRFGQSDHVRKYSKEGFIKRISDAGFYVYQVDKKFLGKKSFYYNALSRTSTLYVGCKNHHIDLKKENNLFGNQIAEIKYSNAIKYSIDGFEVRNNILNIWGWMFCEHSTFLQPCGILCAYSDLDKKKRYKRFVLKPREDVKNVFGEKGYYSGIEVTWDDFRISKDEKTIIEIFFDDGKIIYDIGYKGEID